MKLCEHPDFDQVIIRTSEHFASEGLRPSIIEKDYYVTEALRIIASTTGPQVIFKGGTSLSKGWDLIKRFSEDINIFLDPLAFDPPLRPRGIDRELKALRDAVNQHPALTFLPDESQTIGGFGRNDYFSYSQLFGGVGEIAYRVLLEAGTASGREPTTNIDLSSYVGRFLRESGSDLDVEDGGSFCMRLLHFRRTFVEKMFAIQGLPSISCDHHHDRPFTGSQKASEVLKHGEVDGNERGDQALASSPPDHKPRFPDIAGRTSAAGMLLEQLKFRTG